MQRVAQLFDQRLLAFVRLGQHIDPPLHRLEGRAVLGRQYGEIEIVPVRRHGRIIPPKRRPVRRRLVTDSLRRSRCPHPSPIDTAPIQTFEQSFELRFREPHHAVADGGPGELTALKPLVGQHQARSIPDQDLDPVGTLRSEHDCDPGMGLQPELFLDIGGQPVMALSEIDRLRGDQNLDRL